MSLPTGWEPLPLERDGRVVIDGIMTRLMQRYPGWVPREGAVDTALAEEFGQESADVTVRIVDAFDAASALFYMRAYGLQPLPGAAATIEVRLTMARPGAVSPAGLLLVGRIGFVADDPAADPAAAPEVAFVLDEPVVAGADSTVTATARATQLGDASNGVPAGRLLLITATDAVITVTATGPSAGGVDEEDRDAFLDRAVPYVAVLRPGAVRASDVGPIARSVPGVARVLAVDLYNADTGQDGQARTATVYAVGPDGGDLSDEREQELQDLLESVREVGFVWVVARPTRTAVHVEADVVAEPGADVAVVREAVRAAVFAYLDPAVWGSTASDPAAWRSSTVVRRLQLSGVVGLADGVGYLSDLTLNGQREDLQLAGRAALPAARTAADPTTVTVNVTSPA